jgi:hypothetical protein
MNCVTNPARYCLEVVDVVDFKWLMAHEGHSVDRERLQTDRDYARVCLALAAQSPVEALRRVAQRLSGQLASAAA